MNAQQGELIAGGDAVFAALEHRGEYTGERLRSRRPDTYRAICVLLSQGVGIIRIAGLLRVTSKTVMAVRDQEAVTIGEIKSALARDAHGIAQLVSEGVLERLSTLTSDERRIAELSIEDLKDLASVYRTFLEAGQLLAGEPTSRVETYTAQTPKHEDWVAYVVGLRSAEMDLSVENPREKSGGKPDLKPRQIEAPATIETHDTKSTVTPPQPVAPQP